MPWTGGSPGDTAGKTLAESHLVDTFGLVALGIIREGDPNLVPSSDTILMVDDVVLVEGNPEDLVVVRELQRLAITR